ncbi:hypothetical protein CEXT_223531 [Caerostris extrusa]|uniref:Uncharacterized protein n=1 Tax=Caerostris extrusa TaxID=172846 RepID=A0AAV4XV59_CAEEX|nr:hypothetical protein CEXT_223531 [Caerostris extrusa]
MICSRDIDRRCQVTEAIDLPWQQQFFSSPAAVRCCFWTATSLLLNPRLVTFRGLGHHGVVAPLKKKSFLLGRFNIIKK